VDKASHLFFQKMRKNAKRKKKRKKPKKEEILSVSTCPSK
jgi:hypothetical protein